MQRLLNRLAWRNLPIQAKLGVMFALEIGLIILLSVISFAVLRTVINRANRVSVISEETYTLTNSVVEDIGELQRLQNRLAEEFDDSGFTPAETDIPQKYARTITQLHDVSLPALETLFAEASRPDKQEEISIEIKNLSAAVLENEQFFDRSFDLAEEISHPQDGALVRLTQSGDEFELLIYDQLDAVLLPQLHQLRALEQDLVQTGSDGYLILEQEADTFISSYSRRTPVVVKSLESYLEQANQTATLIDKFKLTSQANLDSLEELQASASRLDNLALSEIGYQIDRLPAVERTAQVALIIGIVLLLAGGGGLTYLFGRSIYRNLYDLLDVTQKFESGDFSIRAGVAGQDEFNQLAVHFNSMALQLEGLVGGLEQRVAERARDLSITAEIGRSVVTMRDPRSLMDEVVELIRKRFGFYHAQVFIIDEEANTARLIASTGTAGRELLARQHQLEVGSLSVIGQVTDSGEPVIAADTDTSQVHRRNELLPDTRSEMALPMRIGEKVIGALDVQSVAPDAFDADDIAVFQTMADQLAIALENARLYNELEQTKLMLEVIQQRATSDAWRAYSRERDPNTPMSYELAGENIALNADDPSPLLSEAIRSNSMISRENGEAEINFAVPIRVRGEVIGAFGFGGNNLQHLSEDEVSLVAAVVDRVGLALENLRLVEQTARRAEYEQIVNEITAKIVGSTDIEHILQTTVKELGRVLQAPQTSVKLRQKDAGDDLG